MPGSIGIADIVVQFRGDVTVVERGYAREKLDRILRIAPVQVTRAVVLLDGGSACPCASAHAELEVNGRVARAQCSAESIFAAVASLEKLIRRAVGLDGTDGSHSARCNGYNPPRGRSEVDQP